MNRSLRRLFIILMVAAMALSLAGAQELTMSFYKQEITQSLPKLLAAFSKANPGITITTAIYPNDGGATLAAAAASGKLPDIMQQQSYSAVIENAKNGYILDLSKQPIMSKVIDGAKPSVTYNGKLYGLPMDFAGIGIIYNKAIFAKYKLTPPKTYLELQKVADTLKKNGVTPFAGLLKENWSIGHFIEMLHSSMMGAKVGNAGIFKFVDEMNAGASSWDKPVDVGQIFRIMDWYKANMDPNAVEMSWDQQQGRLYQGRGRDDGPGDSGRCRTPRTTPTSTPASSPSPGATRPPRTVSSPTPTPPSRSRPSPRPRSRRPRSSSSTGSTAPRPSRSGRPIASSPPPSRAPTSPACPSPSRSSWPASISPAPIPGSSP